MSKKNTTTTTKATKPAKATKKEAKTAKTAKTAPAPKTDKPMSGLDAAAKVLADAKEPMNAKAMVETILASGMWKTNGRTPQATIYAAVIREIAAKGAKARFKKTDRGMFTVNG